MSTDFNRWAPGYDDSPLQPMFQAAQHALMARARRYRRHPHRVLDIGCGTARMLRSAADLFPMSTLVGLDPSGAMLCAAARADHTGRVSLVQAAAERLPFAAGSFDLILSTASFRHWSDPVAATIEVARVLAPRGVFALADLFPVRRRSAARGQVLPRTLTSALAQAGLEVAISEVVPGYGPIPTITIVVARRSIDPQLILAGPRGVRSLPVTRGYSVWIGPSPLSVR